MPRKNKRKDYSAGIKAVIYGEPARNTAHNPECVGCAFSGYGGVCTASEGKCLLGKGEPGLAVIHYAEY